MKTEAKISRVSARVTPSVYNTLTEASEISGATINQFLVQAALEKAYTIIEHENKIKLNRQSADHLFQIIENPPKKNPKLAKAIRTYKQDM
ncbi:conserved hypothetical protein [Desulfamplus magnetovallimortis]|uniref:DUF1778 domain-containing protein n=2 Tax=Desulfamplus magnetovallimortis TaxID=1246637 RepID=A0A1W1HFL9_9BACT|nr:conserved hypothetical protein [Desulfamplus magnetovallimortis]